MTGPIRPATILRYLPDGSYEVAVEICPVCGDCHRGECGCESTSFARIPAATVGADGPVPARRRLPHTLTHPTGATP